VRACLLPWVRTALAAVLAGLCSAASAQAEAFTGCVSADNPPLSHMVDGQARGLDVRIAQAAADQLGRPLKVLPFETSFEKESSLAREVAALLSAGLCDAASGFPLLAGDFKPVLGDRARTPDYPGAKRKRQRPFIDLQPMAPSRGYIGAALGVVQPAGAPALDRLGDLGERRIGVTSGTLGGMVAMGWKHGALRSRLVSLGQKEQALDELLAPAAAGAARRFDAVLMPLALFDGWLLQHPGATLVAAGWRRPIGVNLGFATLASDTTVRPALDAVISRGLADGSLARWAAEEGVTWSAPTLPDVGRGPSLLELMSD
jgi:ABC-type amino acid transport substrate-binding protein